MRTRLLGLSLLAALAATVGCARKTSAAPARDRRLTIFYTAEITARPSRAAAPAIRWATSPATPRWSARRRGAVRC